VLKLLRRAQQNEHGFTLTEVLITIILMIILLGIATSSWFRVVEIRRVDAATNQLAADLRLAHSKATNRLVSQTVTLTAAGDSAYTVTGAGNRDLDDDPDEDLVSVLTPSTIVFNSNGGAQFVAGANPIRVQSTKNTDKCHRIDVNTVTSRIKIVDPCDP